MARNFKTRIIAFSFLLIFVQSIIFPTVSFALTSGPFQQEFMEYTPSGNSDMVDLFTGNLSYSIPLFDIPGPDGNYPISMTYKSGIGLEQESSWVGLGWSLNPGAIVRNVSQYPDDYAGEVLMTEMNHPRQYGDKNWGVDVLGFGFGSYLKFDWGNTFSNRGQFIMNPYGSVANVQKKVQNYTGFMINQLQPSYDFSGGKFRMGNNVGFNSTSGGTVYGDVKTGDKGWQLNILPFRIFNVWKTKPFFELNVKKIEKLYGVLYQSNMPNISSSSAGATYNLYTDPDFNSSSFISYVQQLTLGQTLPGGYTGSVAVNVTKDNLALASDMYQSTPSGSKIYDRLKPVHMAYDNYTVLGENGGSIQPFRFDNPSLSYPMISNQSNLGRISTYKFKITPNQSEKVQFRFVGEASNRYDYHLTASSNYGIAANIQPYSLTLPNCFGTYTLNLNTLNFYNQPVNMTSRESDRAGFKNAQLAQSHYTQWFSNKEINDGIAKSKGFMNFSSTSARNSTDFPDNGIGGYMITDASGNTYHYSLPIYNIARMAGYQEDGFTSKSVMNNRYAFTWLLTAITGSDFIDRNANGICDDQDWGYYVKFNYQKQADDYAWRIPYSGTLYSAKNTKSRLWEQGVRQSYYLNSISTRTHTALFVKENKRDGKSYYGGTLSSIRQSLKLNEIILLKNDDIYNNSTLNPLYQNNTMLLKSNVIDNSTLYSYIISKQITKVTLGTDYRLCNNTPNSFDFNGSIITNPNSGKLTLRSISSLGVNNVKNVPDYHFEYGSNPNYGATNWDAWGAYKNLSSETLDHFAGAEGNAWNLSKITTPLGAEINLEYERDNYDNVNGYNINTVRMGDGVRVSAIKTKDVASGNEYTTRYIYTKDGLLTGKTSGVCSYEPEFARGTNYNQDFYDLFDSPGPMVCYSKVSIVQEVQGGLPSNTPKTVYDFITPNYSMIALKTLVNSGRVQHSAMIEHNHGCLSSGAKDRYGEAYYNMAYEVDNQTSMIGNLLGVKLYNSNNDLLDEQKYSYFDKNSIPNNIGTVTQACNLVDKTLDFYDVESDNATALYARNDRKTIRLINTISNYIPTVLRSVTTYKDGTLSSVSTNTNFDFYTGKVTEIASVNSAGEKFHSKLIPSYVKYSEMGSKVDDPSYKNMLGQETANYLYSVDGSGGDHLISASVQTWKKDAWPYSEFNTTTNLYADVTNSTEIWRKNKNYVWKSAVNQDGTVTSFTDFDWVSTPNAGWQKTNEITRYDHYSKPIESMDINGNYSSAKIGYHNSFVNASSGTSNYRSFTFTGFEAEEETAPSSGKFYFEGEVYRNTGVLKDATKAHTGKYSAKIPGSTGQYGPIYQVSTGIQTNKTYRASAWVYQGSDASTQLVAQLGGTVSSSPYYTSVSMSISDSKAVQVGNWKLLTVNITVPQSYVPSGGSTINDLRIFVSKNLSGTTATYVDDMRLQPVNSPVTGYVYDEQRGLLTAILDNENFATIFTYDAAGRLVRTDKETLTGIKKISETEYHY